MKILSAGQVAEADAYTIENEPVSSIDLMERAATACSKWLMKRFNPQQSFCIFCGAGNNGGDGLVIARKLHEGGYVVKVFLVAATDRLSADCSANLQRFRELNPAAVTVLKPGSTVSKLIRAKDVVIDAILGSGLNRPVKDFPATVIKSINNSKAIVISIDMPSGLFMQDNRGNNSKHIVKSVHTLSLELPKLAFLFPENEEFVGAWSVLPIGLNRDFIENKDCPFHFTEEEMVRDLIPQRPAFAHKGTFGHALLAGGSLGMIGAAVLMAKGCLRSGVGLTTVVSPRCGYPIIQGAVPEALCKSSEEVNILSGILATDAFDALAVGPGIGKHKRTVRWLEDVLHSVKIPLVLDADAINIISENDQLMKLLPEGSILTPHPGEFDRLAGVSSSGYERLEKQMAFSAKHKIYLVVKGKYTAITAPDGTTCFNSTGNSGMATGGSGDVLTGLIAGLLAQGYGPLQACVAGVFIHGLSGDIFAGEQSEEALTAGHIAEGIGRAFNKIRHESGAGSH